VNGLNSFPQSSHFGSDDGDVALRGSESEALPEADGDVPEADGALGASRPTPFITTSK